MNFIPAALIEMRAEELWQRFRLEPKFDVEALLDYLDLKLLWTGLSDGILAEITPYDRRISVNERRRMEFDQNLGLYRFTLAHEVGHWFLHAEGARSGSGLLFDAQSLFGRDGRASPMETQAHKFAGALLAPRHEVVAAQAGRPWEGWQEVGRLAGEFDMSKLAMFIRLKELQLAHEDERGVPASGRAVDPRQGSLL